MKNSLLLSIRIFVFILLATAALAINQAKASHLIGSYFQVTRLDSTRHLVYLTKIRDCNGIQATPGVIHFSSGNIQFYDTLTWQNLVSDKDITGLNPDCQVGSKCSGGSYIYGFQELVFVDTVDLSGYSTCEWTVSLTECCRPSGIIMWPPPTNHYNYAVFNRCLVNSTPGFKSSPRNLIAYNQDAKVSFAVEDKQDVGDSFSYELTPSLAGWNQPTNSTYYLYQIPTYFGSPNQSASLPQGFHLNGQTGMLEFRPSQVNQFSTIVVKVKEWRKINDTMRVISEIRMDNMFIIENTNYAGHTSGINNTPSIQAPDTQFYLCTGDTFRVTISSQDQDADSTYLTWDDGIQGANFTTSYGNDSFASGEFSWAPSPSQVSGMPYYVTFTVRDAICPRPATSSKTIAFYVLDSLNAPIIDLGMDIIDSSQKISFQLIPNVSNINNRPVLWTTTGDGYFANPNAANTTYTQGTGDKSTCSYQLKLEVLNKNYCYANGGVWEDSMLVTKWYDSLLIQGNSTFFYGDSQVLSLDKTAPVGQDIWWTTNGDGHFDDSTSQNPVYFPGHADWSGCGWEIRLNYEKEACNFLVDSLASLRSLALLGHQPTNAVMRGDTVFLEAILDTNANSPVRWRSLGDGIFADTTSLATHYLGGPADLQNCLYEFYVEEWPLHCSGFIDTVRVTIQNPVFEAGSNLQLFFGDTAQLSALPVAGSNYQFGYWSTAGDGHFMDSNDAETKYIPGTGDWANCGTTLYWNEIDQNCGGRVDSLKILRVNTTVNAGNDQSQFYHPSITYTLQGLSDKANGQLAYWTSSGDGSFNDSFDLNAIYTPGTNDLQNCDVTLTLTAYPLGSCTVYDEMQIHIQDSAVKILGAWVDSMAFDTVFVGIYSMANRANLSWSTNGSGNFVSASSLGVAYVLSSADMTMTNLELIVQNNAPCLTSKDTLRVNPTLKLPNGLSELATTYSLFPNPSDGKLHLKIQGADQIQNLSIYDIHGREMRLTPHYEDLMYSWDVSNLSEGMYMLVVTDQQGAKKALRFIVR